MSNKTNMCFRRISLTLYIWIFVIYVCQADQTCHDGETFIFDKCYAAIIESRSLSLGFGWSINTAEDATPEVARTIASELKDRFVVWSSNLTTAYLKSFCADPACDNLIIQSTVNDIKNVDVWMTIEPVEKQFDAQDTETVLSSAFHRGLFDIASVPVDVDYFPVYGWQYTKEFYCEPGWKVIQQEIAKCAQCTMGSHWSAETRGCMVCPRGVYQDQAGQTHCKDCPSGLTTYSSGARDSNLCHESCNSGYFFNATLAACEPCAYGTFIQLTNSEFCIQCLPSLTTPHRGANSTTYCYEPCSTPGYELQTDGKCLPCPYGTYKNETEGPHCLPCREGFNTSVMGASSKEQCNVAVCGAGQFRLLDDTDTVTGRCRDCPIGTYKTSAMPSDATDCASCGDPASWRTDVPGADNQKLCKFYCQAGSHIYDEVRCRQCPQDTYKTGTDYYATQCNKCPPERPRTERAGETSQQACKYANCTAGQEIIPESPTSCRACDVGYYQPVNGPIHERCLRCPAGTTTRTISATSLDMCEAFCASGLEWRDGKCSKCSRGYYKDNTLSSLAKFLPCVLCPSDFITEGEGATTEASCSIRNCTDGTRLNVATNKCEMCVRGTYQDEWWKSSCKACPDPESTTLITGATRPEDCNVYPNHTRVALRLHFDLPWIENYWDHTSDEYISMKTRILAHMTALFRHVTSYRGSLTLKTLSPGSVYAHLVAKFSKNDAAVLNEITSVIDFYIDKYNGLTESDVDGLAPLPVDVRAANIRAAVVIGDGKYDTCLYGEYLSYSGVGGCRPCDLGTYQSRDMTDICRACPSGYSTEGKGTSGTREESCKLICPPGQEGIGPGGGTTCRPCPLGTYKAGPTPDLGKCIPCPAGYSTKTTLSSSPDECIIVCGPGEQISAAETSCEPCPVNTYNPLAFQASCVPCPPWHTTITSAATRQDQCKDPCERNQDVCMNEGACKWYDGSPDTECLCMEGWKGDRCEAKDELNQWIIIGAGAGGGAFVLIIIIISLVICVAKRGKKRKHGADSDGVDNPAADVSLDRRRSSVTDPQASTPPASQPSQQHLQPQAQPQDQTQVQQQHQQHLVTPLIMTSTGSIFQATGVIATSPTPWAATSTIPAPAPPAPPIAPPPPYTEKEHEDLAKEDLPDDLPEEEPAPPPMQRVTPLRSSMKIIGSGGNDNNSEQSKKKKPAKKVKFAKKNQTKSINPQELPRTPVMNLPPSSADVESPYDHIPPEAVKSGPLESGSRSLKANPRSLESGARSFDTGSRSYDAGARSFVSGSGTLDTKERASGSRAQSQQGPSISTSSSYSSSNPGYLLPLRRDVLQQMIMPSLDQNTYQSLNAPVNNDNTYNNGSNVSNNYNNNNNHSVTTTPNYTTHIPLTNITSNVGLPIAMHNHHNINMSPTTQMETMMTTTNIQMTTMTTGSMPQLHRQNPPPPPAAGQRHSSPPGTVPQAYAVINVSGQY